MKTYTPPPRAGQLRTVRRFLWVPLTLRGETRWLEWAQVIQQYSSAAGWLDFAWYRGFT